MVRILVVVAVPAEVDAVLAGCPAWRVPIGPYEALVAERPARWVPTGPYEALVARPARRVPTGPDEAVVAERPARRVPTGPDEAVVADGLTAVAAGVGPARAAAATGTVLALERFDLVLSAGVGGGFAGRAGPGDLVLADRVVHADLGADSPDGFLPVDRLGLGEAGAVLDAGLVARAAGWTGALVGPIITVSTVTGTPERAAELAAAHDAAAEAMEGAGVLAAAQAHGVPFLELRAISNPVGRRDRAGWDLPGALARLGPAVQALAVALAGSTAPTGGGR